MTFPRPRDGRGETVALTACPATTESGKDITISGLYRLEDFEPSDRTAGVFSAYWLVVPVHFEEAVEKNGLLICPHCGTDTLSRREVDVDGYCNGCGESFALCVDEWTLWQQTDPKGYGRFIVQEREWEFAMEGCDE